MEETSVTYHEFAICERIIKKLNRCFACDENFIVKVEILLVRFKLSGMKYRLNTRTLLCPALFVLLNQHFCALAVSLHPNLGSESVFKTASAQFFGVVSQIDYADYKSKCVIGEETALILRDYKFLARGVLERAEALLNLMILRSLLIA